jgi:hypothetical protein
MFKPSLRVALTVFLFCLTLGVTVGADGGSGRLEGRVMARGGVPPPVWLS